METKLLQIADPIQDAALVKQAGKILAAGGLVAIPTETVYGLGANALDSDAVARIFVAKGRPQDNPLIVHITRTEELDTLCRDIPHTARALAQAFWPGPLTMVLPKRDRIPDSVTAGLDTVAVRFPAHPVAQAIIRAAGVPVAAPSANLSGKPSTSTAAHVIRDLTGRVDAIVAADDCSVGLESTVVLVHEGSVRLLRPGGITVEDLESVVGAGNVIVDKGVTGKLAEGETARSPGMKYRHYAPDAEITAVVGEPRDSARVILRRMRHTPVQAVLCYDDYAHLFPNPVPYGASDDGAAQAHRLFDALRSLDGAGVVYAQCPTDRGIGLAVANRLKRAAGFRLLPGDSMTILGLTGGSGTGKGTFGAALHALGVHVIDCDQVYHTLLEEDAALKSQLGQAFPTALQNGRIDRTALSQLVFSDPEKLALLNEIAHRHVRIAIDGILARLRQEGARLAVLDAPTLFESGTHRLCDATVAVLACRETRLQRIMARDGISAQRAAMRINAQPSDDFFRENCDYIIENNADPDALAAQAQALLQAVQTRVCPKEPV